jgi:hypothetical protein
VLPVGLVPLFMAGHVIKLLIFAEDFGAGGVVLRAN